MALFTFPVQFFLRACLSKQFQFFHARERGKIICFQRLASKIELGTQFLFGGGLEAEKPGFVGCIQDLRILSALITLKSKWVDFPEQEVVEAACVMDDKCSPNPCQHGGICKQNSRDFLCECDGTGYSGALCHTSLVYRSCMDFSMGNPSIR